MKSGILLNIITILKPTINTNSYGANLVEYKDYITTRAFVDNNKSGNRINDNNEITFSYLVTFDVRIYHKIDERMRIIFDDKKYRILSITKDRQKQMQTISTELINE